MEHDTKLWHCTRCDAYGSTKVYANAGPVFTVLAFMEAHRTARQPNEPYPQSGSCQAKPKEIILTFSGLSLAEAVGYGN